MACSVTGIADKAGVHVQARKQEPNSQESVRAVTGTGAHSDPKVQDRKVSVRAVTGTGLTHLDPNSPKANPRPSHNGQVGGSVGRALATKKRKLRFGKVEIYEYEVESDFRYKCSSHEKWRRRNRPPFRPVTG